jgi:trans-2,3-dihydro-3-hydroxyanthranilate isomerase
MPQPNCSTYIRGTMRLPYRIVNVFTVDGGRLTGNPLCVFEDGASLNDSEMQALALQFNLSETSFVSHSDKADARVKIFTPSYEMAFAGHPTLGSAHVVSDLRGKRDAVSLELNVGLIPVARDGGLWEFRAKPPVPRVPKAPPATIATAVGLDASDLSGAPLWVSTGTEQLIIPLASEAAVRRAQVSYAPLLAATSDGPRPTAYLFTKRADGSLLSRFFFSQSNVMLEDPATGSATANLGGWYLANETALPFTVNISQGEMTGRPSALRLRIDDKRNVHVAGEVIELGRGYVEW